MGPLGGAVALSGRPGGSRLQGVAPFSGSGEASCDSVAKEVTVASITAINDVGSTVVTMLRNRWQDLAVKPVDDCSFHHASSSEFTEEKPGFQSHSKATLSLLLYRLTVNEHGRQAARFPSRELTKPPLALDLHYLLTAWAGSALEEQVILAWAMQQIQEQPVLDLGSMAVGNWQPDESVQLLPTDLSTEDLMRLWDALKPSYRLSVAYVARVVRVDPSEESKAATAVVATRFGWSHAGQRVRDGEIP